MDEIDTASKMHGTQVGEAAARSALHIKSGASLDIRAPAGNGTYGGISLQVTAGSPPGRFASMPTRIDGVLTVGPGATLRIESDGYQVQSGNEGDTAIIDLASHDEGSRGTGSAMAAFMKSIASRLEDGATGRQYNGLDNDCDGAVDDAMADGRDDDCDGLDNDCDSIAAIISDGLDNDCDGVAASDNGGDNDCDGVCGPLDTHVYRDIQDSAIRAYWVAQLEMECSAHLGEPTRGRLPLWNASAAFRGRFNLTRSSAGYLPALEKCSNLRVLALLARMHAIPSISKTLSTTRSQEGEGGSSGANMDNGGHTGRPSEYKPGLCCAGRMIGMNASGVSDGSADGNADRPPVNECTDSDMDCSLEAVIPVLLAKRAAVYLGMEAAGCSVFEPGMAAGPGSATTIHGIHAVGLDMGPSTSIAPGATVTASSRARVGITGHEAAMCRLLRFQGSTERRPRCDLTGIDNDCDGIAASNGQDNDCDGVAATRKGGSNDCNDAGSSPTPFDNGNDGDSDSDADGVSTAIEGRVMVAPREFAGWRALSYGHLARHGNGNRSVLACAMPVAGGGSRMVSPVVDPLVDCPRGDVRNINGPQWRSPWEAAIASMRADVVAGDGPQGDSRAEGTCGFCSVAADQLVMALTNASESASTADICGML